MTKSARSLPIEECVDLWLLGVSATIAVSYSTPTHQSLSPLPVLDGGDGLTSSLGGSPPMATVAATLTHSGTVTPDASPETAN